MTLGVHLSVVLPAYNEARSIRSTLADGLGFVVREVAIVWRDNGDRRLELARGNTRKFLELLRIGRDRQRHGERIERAAESSLT